MCPKNAEGLKSMSRTARGNARRRISLLATSSFVATSMLSGAGALAVGAMTPSVAMAAILCTPLHPGAADWICTGAGTGNVAGFVDTLDFQGVTQTAPGQTSLLA